MLIASLAPVLGSDEAAIGRKIFLDTNLSQPAGQGCVSCHPPDSAFADPRPVSPGAVAGRMGTRNSPTLMYAALIPAINYGDFYDKEGAKFKTWIGGLFHDGRARDLFEQVQQPFFNPAEMNLSEPAALAAAIRESDYANDFRERIGDEAWNDDDALLYNSYRALVAFLKEPLFRPFDARIDDYLKGDEAVFNESERRGFSIFTGAAMCIDCHVLTPASWEEPLLSDFRYHNLGVPSRGIKDPGLGARTGKPEELGKFRTPSLRNIALTAPYMHNGAIATLKEVIEFYNKRNVEPDRWGSTDFPDTIDHKNIGNLGLSDRDVDDLVALLKTFTDRSLLEMKQGAKFPAPSPGTPETSEAELLFPDWTHRLHPAFPGKTDLPE